MLVLYCQEKQEGKKVLFNRVMSLRLLFNVVFFLKKNIKFCNYNHLSSLYAKQEAVAVHVNERIIPLIINKRVVIFLFCRIFNANFNCFHFF